MLGAAYFKEIAAIINAGGVPDMEKIKSTMIKYGLIPLQLRGEGRQYRGVDATKSF